MVMFLPSKNLHRKTDDNKVIAVCETSDLDEFMKVFNAPETAEAMQHDGITGGVEVFVLDDSFKP